MIDGLQPALFSKDVTYLLNLDKEQRKKASWQKLQKAYKEITGNSPVGKSKEAILMALTRAENGTSIGRKTNAAKNKTTKLPVSIALDEEQEAKIKALAELQNISISQFITDVLNNYETKEDTEYKEAYEKYLTKAKERRNKTST